MKVGKKKKKSKEESNKLKIHQVYLHEVGQLHVCIRMVRLEGEEGGGEEQVEEELETETARGSQFNREECLRQLHHSLEDN